MLAIYNQKRMQKPKLIVNHGFDQSEAKSGGSSPSKHLRAQSARK